MKIIPGFRHVPGLHCGSTGLRDLLRHAGLDYSEAMCFGLGSGLGFFYYQNPRVKPISHLFYGRTINLEREACAHLALDFREGVDDDGGHAWHAAKEWIDQGVPLLLHVELSQLPYYKTRIPFPGHRVVLAGYDDERQIALLADTGYSELQPIPYETLARARSAQIPPIPLHNEWLAVKPTPAPGPLAEAIRVALRDNALGMNLDHAPYLGIMGMESLAEDFENWGAAPDWELCARFAYQNIEVRGTGGGFFRKMYVQFLREAEAVDMRLQEAKLADAMEEIADEWTALGVILQQIATGQDRMLFKDASRAIRRLAMREENFWGRVLNLRF